MKSLTSVYDIVIRLDVKRETDEGAVLALDSIEAPEGTIVYFNKPFRDIDSIVASAFNTSENINVIVSFEDVPNPTMFTVYAYKAGNRTQASVAWIARGKI